MSRKQKHTEPAEERAQKRGKKSSGQFLSLVGGAVFFSLVAAFALNRNEHARAELDAQVKGFLKTTRTLLAQYGLVAQRIGDITTDLKSVKPNNKNEEKLLPAVDSYELLWEPIEQSYTGKERQTALP